MKNKQAEQWAKDNPEKIKEHQKKWYDNNKDKKLAYSRASKLKRKYGLSIEEYKDKLVSQGHACKICGAKTAQESNPNREFAVDHCHITGKVRGLLCIKCNTGIGMFNDNTELLISAYNYLKEYE